MKSLDKKKGIKDFYGHNYYENDYDKKKELSSCCNAGVTINSGGEGTRYYVCDECHEPCDLKSWKSLDKKKAKELDWEKEFKYYCNKEQTEILVHPLEIKSFIKDLLTQQRTELLEEIKKIDFTPILEAVYDNGTLDIKPISGFLKETVLKQGNMYIKEDIISLLNKKDE